MQEQVDVSCKIIQGSSKRWSPGCVNAAGNARQKWKATAGTKITKPGDRLSAEPCNNTEK